MFAFACPRCHTLLEQPEEDHLVCPADGLAFQCVKGVWRMLLPERQGAFEQFIREYETVRQAEGRGSAFSAYYQALPYKNLSKRLVADWPIRAASFNAFLRQALVPYERERGHALRCLDLGAGNGWLSNRLAIRGHRVAAVDLTTNDFDGLGCYRYYETQYWPVQAEFDHLPFMDGSVDLALFNASLHYSTGYERTLREALRVIDEAGRLVILDSPFYRDPMSGEQMVKERQAHFVQKYGFPSDGLESENYLTYRRLEDLASSLGLDYQIFTPHYGLGWALRPVKARLLGRREPARFHLVILKRRSSQTKARSE